MKRRLLMLLSVFMTITSVGWLQAQDTSGDGYTKTGNDYTVTTAEGLQKVLEILNSGTSVTTTITLKNDLDISKVKFMGPNPTKAQWQGIFYLNATEAKITSLTIDGAGHSITGENTSNTVEGSFDPTKNYVFYFDGSGSSPITFKDLTVRNTNILAFNLYNLNNLVFNKVALNGNAEGGLHLNSSQLTATDFTTSGNGKFAVKLSRQVDNMPKFTLVSGTINENDVPKIVYYDRYANGTKDSFESSLSASDIADCVATPTGENWYRSLQYATLHTSKNGALAYVWAKDNDAVTVNTAGQLDSTINLGFATVNKVNLAATTYELGKQLVINRPLTIEGKEATTIKANGSDWSGTNSVKNLISIENGQASEDVILKNLTIEGSKAAGINAQSPMTTSLVNVTLKGNATAGLLVHSKVSAEGLHTEGNVWGGVNVGTDGTPVYSPKFTFSPDCSFAESSKIWSEDITTDPKQLVEGPNGWTSYVGVQGASSEEKRYWTNSKLQMEYVANFYTDKTLSKGYTLIYANGNPVTVEALGNDKVKISAGADDVLEVETTKNPVIFGGAKFGDVESSNITMKSGKVEMIIGGGYLGNVKNANVTITGGEITNYFVGGGYGPSQAFGAAGRQTADVTGKATVKIDNATVRYLISGGLMYAKTAAIDIAITGENTKISYALGGGYAPVGDGQSLDKDFANASNSIATTNFSMTKGTVNGAICLGGGYSYSYAKDVTATLNGVTINGGLYGIGWNGSSDKVNATISNTTFNNVDDYTTIATLVRGKANEVSMAFDNCTFAEGYECYLGADKDWQNGNYPTPVSGKTTMTFVGNAPVVKASEGLQNVTVNGAKVNVDKFLQKATGNVLIDKFEISSDKTWSFNKGMTVGEGVTLTNNGTLNVKGIDNVADLQAAVAVSANNIGLEAGKYELASHLLIAKPISIEGTITDKDSTIIKAASNWSGSDNETKNLVRIDASKTSLKNLLVEGCTSGSGINVYKATGVTLDNVISRNNKAAGLIVNGSTVSATNFRTSGNGWYGVNVDKGEGVQGTPVFTIGTGCSFAEAIAIYADLKNAPDDDASTYVVSNDWVMTKVAEEHKYRWVNAASSGIDYAITSVPATVVYGSANLPLISNADSTKTVKFSVPANNGFVSIKAKEGEAKYDSLQILKPGLVTITMSVGDTTVTQQLEVLKRQLTIKGVTAVSKEYDGTTTVALNVDSAKVSGYLNTTKVYGDLFEGIYGTLTSKDAGIVPVELKAFFNTGITDSSYYDLNYVTVMDTVKKKDLKVTAAVPANSKAINYGTSLPAFTATTNQSDFVADEDVNVLGGKLQFDCPATSTSLAGTYPVMPYGYTSNNYNISYVADSLKINAVAPIVELVSATVSANKSEVTAKGRIISNGGTPTTDLKGGFIVGDAAKESSLTVGKDGTFSAGLTGLGSGEIIIKATASAGSLTGTSGETKVDLNKDLQNVNFVSEVSRLTYGSTAKLSAKDFAEGAKVTFAIAEGGVTSLQKIDSTTIKAIGKGTATITVTAEKDGFITAVAKQTVTVEPKNLTVTPGKIEKAYDGELTATLPGFTLNGIIEGDKVTVSTSDVTASFVDKNVGTNKPVILTGNLTLTDTNATNYTLTQPTNLKGTITKGSPVTVIVSDVKRKYNETTLKYKLQIMAGEVDLTSTPYTGKVVVTEKSDTTYTVSSTVSFPNYGDVTVQPGSGKVEIEKGTPKVLTYNTAEGKVEAELLDAEGWSDAKVGVVTDSNSGSYAQVTYNNGTQTVRGASLEAKKAPEVSWNFSALKTLRATKAATVPDMSFGQSMTLVKQEGLTYSVVNTKVLTLTTNADGNYVVNAVGVGTGAITATDGAGAVAYCSIKVDPAVLTVFATGTDKTYDNTPSANVSLTIENMPEGVALDLNDVTFNYTSANVGNDITIEPSKPLTLTGANAANYVLKSETSIKGKITPRDLTITSPISKYYDGATTLTLSGYSAEGLIAGEAVPTVTATFGDAAVDVNKEVTLKTTDKNYKLTEEATGNIVKSTLDATLPTGASGVENLKNNVKLVVRETGATVTRKAVSYDPTVTTEGSGSNTVYYISGGDNDNYSVVYGSNQLGFKADPVTPPSGGDEDETVTITLDATTKDLPRTEEFILTATVSPAGKTVTWSSSDPTVASVTADGNKVTVKGVKVGTATITATIGDVTATCEVTVGFATGLEEALANTEVFGRKGNIYVNPIQPLQVTVVNMIGKIVYNARISGNTQIPVTKGIYIVKLTNAGNSIVTKVNVY